MSREGSNERSVGQPHHSSAPRKSRALKEKKGYKRATPYSQSAPRKTNQQKTRLLGGVTPHQSQHSSAPLNETNAYLLGGVAHLDAAADLLQPAHHVVQHVLQIHLNRLNVSINDQSRTVPPFWDRGVHTQIHHMTRPQHLPSSRCRSARRP